MPPLTRRELPGAAARVAVPVEEQAPWAGGSSCCSPAAVCLTGARASPRRALCTAPPCAPTPHGCRVAEACVATLQEMNPFVKLASLGGSVAGALNRETLAQYDLVLLCGQPAGTVAAADRLCAEAGAAFYAAACRGISGWAFANLHQHSYVVEVRRGSEAREGRKGGVVLTEAWWQAGGGSTGCPPTQSKPRGWKPPQGALAHRPSPRRPRRAQGTALPPRWSSSAAPPLPPGRMPWGAA